MEIIDTYKLNAMQAHLGCVFTENGTFAEMMMYISDYREKTLPIKDTTFGFYHGDTANLKQLVASVDDDWVKYFDEDSQVFCGSVNGQTVSFCIVDTDAEAQCILSPDGKPVGTIGCVGTAPQFRGLGIGLRMVDLATVYLKEHCCLTHKTQKMKLPVRNRSFYKNPPKTL